MQEQSGVRALPYLAGLDGLRAVAVVAVFLFHGGVAWAGGGYLAVSTFFTLSGFLITTLVLREHATTGTIRLGAFWERRVRRLLPALVLGIAAAGVVTIVAGDAAGQRAFVGDGLSALFDVANWRFVLSGQSYAAMFSAPSALQHAWSLAIEAQFYWLFPVLALGVMRLARGHRAVLGGVLMALITVSIGLTRFGGFDHDRIYYGTDTRAAELLIGALLAVVVAGRPDGVRGPWSPTERRVVRLTGSIGAVALVGCWLLTPQSAAWIDAGGLVLYAMASAGVVLAAAVPGTALSVVLGVAPLRMLGRISYGVYLFHWPVLLWLTPERVALPTALRLTLAGTVTIGLAALSHHLVELPIRGSMGAFGRVRLGPVVVAAAVVALVPIIVVGVKAPPADERFDLATGSLVSDISRLASAPGGTVAPMVPVTARVSASTMSAPPITDATGALVPKPIARPSRPLRLLVVGDSIAAYIDPLLNTWGEQHGVWSAVNYARIGCGVVVGGDARTAFLEGGIDPVCNNWEREWPQAIKDAQPDMIVLGGAFWEATDRRLPGDTVWRSPGDPVYDQVVRNAYARALDVLTATGTPVAWLDHPPIFDNEKWATPVRFPQVFDVARMDRLDVIQRAVAAGRPLVRIMGIRSFLEHWPGGVGDPALRPDGMHFDGPRAFPVADWLGPEILAAYWSTT